VEILKFESSAPQPRRKKKSSNKPLLAVVGIAAVAVLGSTLAANISLNSGANVEFGQGVAQTSSCDPTTGITVNPSATYQNVAGAAGSFKFGTISFTGIAVACADKLFTIKAYGNSSSTPITLNSVSGTTAFDYATFTFASPTAANKSSNINTYVAGYSAGASDNGTYVVAFPTTGQIDPALVYKITLESSAS
jgi:hypothetical protein